MQIAVEEVSTYIRPIFLFDSVEENFIPLEPQSQGSAPVIPSEPESKGKGKRHSERLITAKTWTPIATQRIRKPQTSASIQGKPTLRTCTGKITVIAAVVTFKGKLLKSVDNKFVQGTVNGRYANKIKFLTSCKHSYVTCTPQESCNPKEPARGQKRPGRGHLGHSGRWKDMEGNHTHSAVQLPIQQKPQTRGLEGYGSSSSDPPTPQRYFPIEKGKQEVQPWITLGITWSKLPEGCLKEIPFKNLMVITK
ncbi:hypothetical protein O181_058309 [Austropuccinia psidii MF-1]|uniref:Uncharacterized protein n=1 Tax=Austropuccinia psidii MF-1 TaxID=1389203 RepID=A0A9Q3EC28_9BASI|nr:hypothetical protein [Austropuccinia psidii MF-1]